MTRRHRLARERAITALLAVAELEHIPDVEPRARWTAQDELRAAMRGLYQVVVAEGRKT